MIATSQRTAATISSGGDQQPARSDESEMSSGSALAAPAYYRRPAGEPAASRHVATSAACCSVKIQQKQQKFLAAAARSATSLSAGVGGGQRRAPCACNHPVATSVTSTPTPSTTSISTSAAAATLMAAQQQCHKQQQQQQADRIASEQQQQREMSTGMEATSAPILIGASGSSDSADASRPPAQAVAVAAAAAAKASTAAAAVAVPEEQQRQRRPRQQQAGVETAGEAQMSVAEAAAVAVGGGAATGAKEAKGVVAVDGRQASDASQQHRIVQPRYIQFHNFNINNTNNNNLYQHHHHHHNQHHHHTSSHQHQHRVNHNPQPHHHLNHGHQQHHNHYQHSHGHSQHHQPSQQQLHHHHHHHHHQHLNQQQHQHNMAHYKFHNDCQSSVLTYEQVKRLDFVMDQTVPIHGRGNYPTLYVKLKELIRLVKHKLQTEHSIEIRDVRLNGGAASYVLAPENSHYNDLDLIFGTDLSDQDQFDVIRDVVLECLKEFLPKDHHHNHQHHHFNPQTPFGPDSGQGSHESLASNSSAASSSDLGGGSTNIDNGGGYATTINNNSSSCDSKRADDSGNSSSASGQQHQSTTMIDNDDKVTTSEVMTGNCDSADDSGKDMSEIRGESGQREDGDWKDKEKMKNAKIVDEEKFKTNCTYENDSQVNLASKGYSEENQPRQQQIQDSSRMVQCHHHQPYQMPLSNCVIKEAYVHKMVKVNDDDRWSLISLGVQHSEANCGAVGQSAPALSAQQQQQLVSNSQHENVIVNQQQQFPINLVLDAADSQRFNNSQTASAPIMNVQDQPQQQATHPYHHHHHSHQQHPQPNNHHHLNNQRNHYQQQKQFPNSIELKFVDRMRRKFEFSVDSFQIILDSLIQFYDYAPQSTIASQRKLISSHPSSTMINTRPLMGKKMCAGCYVKLSDDNNDSLSKLINGGDNYSHSGSGQHFNNNNNHHHQKAHCAYPGTNNKQQPCDSLLNNSRSYYQLPLEPSNSPSISSVASSSGCSSSSSVVSSSSSSLSCDEDHEDLYCDGDSPSSSSASTSSLLSSTTSSLLSSGTETLVSREDLSSKCAQNDGQAISPTAKQLQQQQRQRSCDNNNKDNASTGSSSIVELASSSSSTNNIESTPPHHAKKSSSLVEVGHHHGHDGDCFECFEGLPHHQHNHHNMFDYCDMNGGGTSCAVISENFYPTVIGRSEYGDFKEALYHLEKKLIATRSPEEIRGGGLLKYCNLLVKNYKPTNVYQIRTLERYMCSRFFIDFSDLSQQQAKLESYLANHFSDDPILKFDYLTILHNVVQRSTVCLMNHELRLTLNMIRDLAFKQNEQQQSQQQQQLVVHQQQPHQQLQDQKQIQPIQNQAQQQHQQQHYYQQQKPVLLQSGVYRVKLVNYTLAKLVRP